MKTMNSEVLSEEKEKRRLQLVAYYRSIAKNAVKDNHKEYAEAMLDAFENNKPVPQIDIYGRLSVSHKRQMLRFAQSTPVYCEETGKTYKSIRACAKELKIDANTVTRWIDNPMIAKLNIHKITEETKHRIDG